MTTELKELIKLSNIFSPQVKKGIDFFDYMKYYLRKVVVVPENLYYYEFRLVGFIGSNTR